LSVTLLVLAACSGPAVTPTPEPAPEPAPAPTMAPAPAAPAGLPGLPPKGTGNPPTPDKITLGHALFMDPRLSADGSRGCYSCHVNERGNADGRATALGAMDKPLPRNTPTIWNVGYLTSLYWDGRAANLEAQAMGAWKGGNMGVGADNLAAKAAEIGALPEYAAQFASVFHLEAGAAVEPNHVVQAIAAFERTLLCGDPDTMSEAAARGKAVFQSKGRCITCHTPPLYTDNLFHNIGLGGADIGRGKVTGDQADNGKFRTPTLRNAADTAPYFHDGRIETLEEAVRYMAGGGNADDPGNDPLLAPTGLDDAEIADLIAFIESLRCEGTIEVTGDPKPVPID